MLILLSSYINNMIFPALEMAVDEDIIRKNPAKGSIADYGRPAKERVALTISQQEKLIDFVKQSNVYNTYDSMLTIIIGTGLRCGELIGLTWKDVDTGARRLNADHQLIYKNYGDGCCFHISTPKTDFGIRVIPMTQKVQKAFVEQRKNNFMLAKDKSFEVDVYNKAEAPKGEERTQESRIDPKGFNSYYVTHSMHKNGRVPYGH